MAEGTVQLAEWLFTDLLTRNELDTYILIKVAAPCLHSYRCPHFRKFCDLYGVDGEGRGMGRNYSVHNTMQRAKSTLFPRA